MYERNRCVSARKKGKFLERLERSRVRLHHLPSQGLMHFIHGRFKTDCSALCEEIFARHMCFHFDHLILTRITLLYTKKNFTVLQLIVERQQLLQLRLDEVEQCLVGIKMDGMNLNLHPTTRLMLPRCSLIQRRSVVKLLQLCCRVLGVHLRRRQTGMAKKVLDRRQFGAAI